MPRVSVTITAIVRAGRRASARPARMMSCSMSEAPDPQTDDVVWPLGAITVEFETVSPAMFRRQVGQLLIAGFDGTQLPVELKALAREFGLGGVILFARNIVEPEQVAEVCDE